MKPKKHTSKPKLMEKEKEKKREMQEKGECFCGKGLLGGNWVECDNGDKCEGYGWYHYTCVGLSQDENLDGVPFVCQFCKDLGEEGGEAEEEEKQNK